MLLATPASATTGLTLIRRCDPARQLAPGVTYQHCVARLSSMRTAQPVYTVSWKMGDPRVSIGSALMSTVRSNGSMTDGPISRWAAGRHGVIAAENGDFFTYATGAPSGLLVHGRHVSHFGPGGEPVAGYESGGRVIFGQVAASPQLVQFPGGTSATVAGFGVQPLYSDQVGVYEKAGQSVTIGTKYAAVMLTGNPFSASLSGMLRWADPTGRQKADPVGGFVLHQSGARVVARSYPARAVTTRTVTVPRGDVLLTYLKAPAGVADVGFTAVLGEQPVSVVVTQPTDTWRSVTDTMGGKPMMVVDGRAVTRKPPEVTDPDQWYPQQLRPAIATTAGGRAAMVIIGLPGWASSSTTGPQFALMLQKLGYTNALQFDNRTSTELYRPAPNDGSCLGRGSCHGMYRGWERDIPAATVLSRAP